MHQSPFLVNFFRVKPGPEFHLSPNVRLFTLRVFFKQSSRLKRTLVDSSYCLKPQPIDHSLVLFTPRAMHYALHQRRHIEIWRLRRVKSSSGKDESYVNGIPMINTLFIQYLVVETFPRFSHSRIRGFLPSSLRRFEHAISADWNTYVK